MTATVSRRRSGVTPTSGWACSGSSSSARCCCSSTRCCTARCELVIVVFRIYENTRDQLELTRRNVSRPARAVGPWSSRPRPPDRRCAHGGRADHAGLVAAVSNAGGLGFLAAGYLSADALAERIAATRALTVKPFGVNLFVPVPARRSGDLRGRCRGAGRPRWDDDDWDASSKLSRAIRSRRVVHVRLPGPAARRAGDGVGDRDEPGRGARRVAAGAEGAGRARRARPAATVGHGGRADIAPIGLLALLQLIDAEPVVASGGIATAAAVHAALRSAPAAVQVGSALLLADEAGTVAAYRERLAAGDADRPHARVQRPARAWHPEPLHGRAPRRAARVPRDPPRHGEAARRGAQGRRRGRLQPVGRRGVPARPRVARPRTSPAGWQELDQSAEALAQVVVEPADPAGTPTT